MKITFKGTVDNGLLKLNNRDKFQEYLKTISGPVELSIRKWSDSRSNQQNRYYWGVVVDMIAENIGESREETHELLKSQFLRRTRMINDKEFSTNKSTTTLSTVEMNKYVCDIVIWASSFLGLVIPDPE